MVRLARNVPPPGEPAVMADAEPVLRVGRRQHPGWWLVTAAVLVLVALLVRIALTNPNLQWGVVAHYFFSTDVLKGLLRTIELTVLSMAIGISIGVAVAVMRLSPVPILSSLSWTYVWFFRGTPLLVQIVFWYNLSALVRTLSIGIPFGPTFVSGDVNQIVTPFAAALLGLGLNEGAYMSEIVRGGIQAVDHGQVEAATALGMRRGRTMRRIVLPQAMRVILPPTGNQVIGMLKSSSLVSVTSLPELLYTSQLIYQRTFETIPLLIVASLWYLIVTSVLSVGQYYVERHYARGSARSAPLTPPQRLRRRLARLSAAWARRAEGAVRP
jgi:polar amino acid transport system permease protein